MALTGRRRVIARRGRSGTALPRDEAVDGERQKRAGPEPAGQPAHRRVGGDERHRTPDENLAADAVPEGPEQFRELQHAGGEDDRRREQEREPRGVLVGQPPMSPPTMEMPER